ncbi:MAG: serine/threonine protein phosphatase [Okeania sp. SIO2C2]|uniref:metallophosphoesterase family protein n=1 Tax=Okeania sp. SIO2C2 TaxID=2607787 RepID=UPI0013B71614|nr:metallophosphoesterase family protein [Okeania sp. SIO2C2]NEP89189.1 serine/threonine protein phosphatase [Okeania sp. SIO2C2]
MKQRRIIIGDVHGHYDGLMVLLEAIAPGKNEKVYFLGDLIDRGPKSSQVIEFVRNSSYQSLQGNHEQMMIQALSDKADKKGAWEAWFYSGGNETVESYRDQGIMPYEDVEWIRSLPLYLDLGDIWLVHAGVNPKLPIQKQTYHEYCWIRKEFHGIEKPYFPNKLMIIGHTITFTFNNVEPGELVRGAGWLNIDTSAYHPRSGWLTGLDVDNNIVYQVNVNSNETRKMPLEELVKPYASKPTLKEIMQEPLLAKKKHKEKLKVKND